MAGNECDTLRCYLNTSVCLLVTLRACCAAFLVSATVYMIRSKGQYVTLVVKSLSLQDLFQGRIANLALKDSLTLV